MRKLHLMGVYFRSSFQKESAYRFNFGANLLSTLLSLAGSIGGILVLFSAKKSLNGWTFYEMLTLTGVYLLIQALKNLVTAPSLNSLTGFTGELWTGKFDFILLKPVSPQFQISFKEWSLWSVFDMLLAIGLLCVSIPGISRESIHAAGTGELASVSGTTAVGLFVPGIGGVSGALLFAAALAVSLLMVYSILLLLGSAAFWYLGTPLSWIFDAFLQAGRFPVGIYPGAIRLFLTWLIPVGFVVTMPAEILAGRAAASSLAFGALLAVLLFVGSSLFFRASLKKYSSASS